MGELRAGQVVMSNFGGMGNRMFRFMLAQKIAAAMGWPLVGYELPEWGLAAPLRAPPEGHGVATGWRHRQDVAKICARAHAEQADFILVDSFAQRLEHFADRRSHFAALFAAPPGAPVGSDELAINIRTGDILEGYHKDYTPLPLAFYARLIAQTGLAPVFVGQVEDNWYTAALRRHFPQARFLSGGPVADFQTIRGARHMVLAVSSFSWLAAWLSASAQTIHLPLAGLLNPQQRPDIDLIPQGDARWQCHAFAPDPYVASEAQKAVLIDPQARPAREGEAAAFLGYRCGD